MSWQLARKRVITGNPRIDLLVQESLAFIDNAVREYDIKRLYALFSGGHDSLVASHVLSHHPRFAGAIHINTGIGIEKTREFVRFTCQKLGWQLIEKSPVTTYKMLIVEHGFPGPHQHNIIYRYLKERPLNQVLKEIKNSDRHIGFVTGVRTQESIRRMGTVDPLRKDKAKIWIAPIADWTKHDCENYIDAMRLMRNWVVQVMHMSGECLCGAFARPDERREINYWYPEAGAQIDHLEELVRLSARDGGINQRHCEWGWKDGIPMAQDELFPLCHYCRGHEETNQ